MEHPELEFFNNLSGKLSVELTEAPERLAPHLSNVKASPTARVLSVQLAAEVFDAGELRPLTEAELASVAFDSPHIRLRGESGEAVAHDAPNGKHFTVKELVAAIEETERRMRQA